MMTVFLIYYLLSVFACAMLFGARNPINLLIIFFISPFILPKIVLTVWPPKKPPSDRKVRFEEDIL